MQRCVFGQHAVDPCLFALELADIEGPPRLSDGVCKSSGVCLLGIAQDQVMLGFLQNAKSCGKYPVLYDGCRRYFPEGKDERRCRLDGNASLHQSKRSYRSARWDRQKPKKGLLCKLQRLHSVREISAPFITAEGRTTRDSRAGAAARSVGIGGGRHETEIRVAMTDSANA